MIPSNLLNIILIFQFANTSHHGSCLFLVMEIGGIVGGLEGDGGGVGVLVGTIGDLLFC
ncbi:hypothetical protein ACJX0J_022414, partial [Zea mays]